MLTTILDIDFMPITVDSSIFRAYDIRGVVNQTLTEEAVYWIGRAVATEVQQAGCTKIVVGRDGRLSGPVLTQSLLRGLLEGGVDVIEVGCVPTPIVYFAGLHYGESSCIAITGSHNPPEYNGLKIVVAGETLSAERIQRLRERIETQDLSTGQGTASIQAIYEVYAQAVCERVRLKRPLKVVVDAGNGVAGGIAPALLQRLGCAVDQLYCEVDGHFPNHHPDPSQPENLTELIERVQQTQADIGLAFDGDGDRLGVVDNQGTIIYPDRQLILFAQSVLERVPNAKIIFDVKCSVYVPRMISQKGGEPIMSRTGHSFIKKALKEHKAALAGEMSGHIFFNDNWFGFDDALFSAARLLEIISKQGDDTATLFAQIPNSINTPELNIAFSEGEHYKIMQRIIDVADFPDGTTTTIDGLRVDFAQGWGLVRPSNTTPVLVLRFEAETQTILDEIMRRFVSCIQKAAPHAKLPAPLAQFAKNALG